jgi:putative flippase GtrA
MGDMKKLLDKLWQKKVVRFMVVGCFNTVLDTSILLFGYKILGLNELIANTISVSIAITVSYFLNHRIVFRYHEHYSLKRYLHFFAVTGISIILIQDLIIYLATKVFWPVSTSRITVILGHSWSLKTIELLGAKIAAVLIAMVWNFLLYKYIIFKHKDIVDESEEIVVA